ncbi:MAG: PorT family protein [Bacteroidales bacterium]|nr:PorT family protein [Bacteroidales bacterium]
MKNTIILFAFLVIGSVNLLAQNDEFIPSYSFGIKQGINYSSVIFNPGINESMTLGYSGGIVYKYHNERLFGLQLELIFNQKGWTEDLDTINNSYSRKMNYLEIPLMTQIIFGKKQTKYYVNLGTSFGYLLSEKEKLTINNDTYVREYYDQKIEKKFDYSGLGEIGAYFNTSIGELQIGLRYQMSLTDLFKTSEESYFPNQKNQLYNLSVSWFFLSNKE